MEIFSTGYYKINRVSLILCGLWPEQGLLGAYTAQFFLHGNIIALIIPEMVYFYKNSVHGSIMNDAILCLPSMFSLMVGVVKLFLMSRKKTNFQTAIDEIRNDWRLFGNTPAGVLMHRYAARGRICTLYYSGFLFPALTLFLGYPMVPVFMDLVSPLNETRPRPPLYEADYGFKNPDDHFFFLNLHGYIVGFSLITILWTVDSFIMILVQHCCGLFDIVGFTLGRLNNEKGINSEKDQNDIIRHAISVHKRAILFADFISDSLVTMYAYVIFLNMVVISVTGVGAVFQMDHTSQAINFAILGVGQMAHLFFNSIPGQQLIDHSSRVFDTIYYAEWHLTSINSQKLILMMLMRSRKPNNLTAGGFYLLNMENFSQIIIAVRYYVSPILCSAKTREWTMTIFSTGYYKINRIFLTLCGIWPEQQLIGAYTAQVIVIGILFSLIIPEAVYFYENALHGSIMNDAILSLPSMLSLMVGVVKLFLVARNKTSFQTAIDEIRKDWKLLGNSPANILMHRYAARGRACTLYYMSFLFPALTLFLGYPMVPIFLDFVFPLNETRPRPPLYEADYGVKNPDDYFYLLTIHGYIASITIIIVLWTVDSFIMVLVQHCCGLFEIVGFTLQRLNTESGMNLEKNQNDVISHAISVHKRAIKFADFIGDSLMTMYAYVIFLNMVVISVTGVGAVFQMDHTSQAINFAILGLGQMAHLFFNSIPGQQLIDHSSQVFDTIYCAEWHSISIKSQKLILMMLMRSRKPNNLTAGGFYQLNMENFSQVMQTSMSYMTMLLSLG